MKNFPRYKHTKKEFVLECSTRSHQINPEYNLIAEAMFLAIYMEGLVQSLELNNIYIYAYHEVCPPLSQ